MVVEEEGVAMLIPLLALQEEVVEEEEEEAMVQIYLANPYSKFQVLVDHQDQEVVPLEWYQS